MGESIHSFIGVYMLHNSKFFDMEELTDSEIVEVNSICDKITPKLNIIKHYFEVDAIEQWIGSYRRVDCILKHKQTKELFLAEWKISFSSTSLKFRRKDLKQLISYLNQIKSIDYGFLCYFTPIGDTLFYFTDIEKNMDIVNSKLNDKVMARVTKYIS